MQNIICYLIFTSNYFSAFLHISVSFLLWTLSLSLLNCIKTYILNFLRSSVTIPPFPVRLVKLSALAARRSACYISCVYLTFDFLSSLSSAIADKFRFLECHLYTFLFSQKTQALLPLRLHLPLFSSPGLLVVSRRDLGRRLFKRLNHSSALPILITCSLRDVQRQWRYHCSWSVEKQKPKPERRRERERERKRKERHFRSLLSPSGLSKSLELAVSRLLSVLSLPAPPLPLPRCP